jgi:hypothetical protein
MAIQISGCPVIDNSRNLTNIANATTAATVNTYVLRGADGKICASSLGPIPLRGNQSFEGGSLICISSGVYWIVAPNSSEVSRTWYLREDANTLANTCTSCTGWFVPTVTQLQNPGYRYRVYWDSFSSTPYWSSTECNATCASRVFFQNGTAGSLPKDNSFCVRAFRCVTY